LEADSVGALDVLNMVASHISTVMIVTGLLHLTLFGIHQSSLPEYHPAKKYGKTAISVALFPVGIVQIYTLASYILALAGGNRLPTDPWGVTGTLLYCVVMGVGGFSGFSQIGRKCPWAVMLGGGTAVIGGGALYHFASSQSIATLPALAGSVFIGFVLYVAMFFITLPWSEGVKTLGNVTAFSPFMLGTSVVETLLGTIAAMRLVIL